MGWLFVVIVGVGVGAGVGTVRGRAATVGAGVGVGGDVRAVVEPDHLVLLLRFGFVWCDLIVRRGWWFGSYRWLRRLAGCPLR